MDVNIASCRYTSVLMVTEMVFSFQHQSSFATLTS